MQSIARSSCSIRAVSPPFLACVFFFNDTATTEIYTLSLHDALPISPAHLVGAARATRGAQRLENQKMGLGDLLAVADDLLALAYLQQHVLHLRALHLLPAARLGVVVGEVRPQRPADQLRGSPRRARRQVRELGCRRALDVLPRVHQILDAVDVPDRLLGSSASSDGPDHDPALAIGGEQPPLLHHETR